MTFKQPALPSGKAPLSNLSKLRDVAAIGCTDPDLGVRQVQVYDWFELWNERFFSNRLRPVHVNISLTSYGKSLGLCQVSPVQLIEIHPQCWKGKARHHSQAVGNTELPSAAWVVLHEMMHLVEAQTVGFNPLDNCHATPTWVAWCNYIAQGLDLPLSYAKNKRGKAKADADGVRANIWKPVGEPVIREGTRLATYDETRCFPFLEPDPLMQGNLEVRGEQTRLPQF